MEKQNDLGAKRKTPSPLALAMFSAGITYQHVADVCEITQPTVANVLAGRDKSTRVVIAVAKMIGKSERWVFQQINAHRRPRREPQAAADNRTDAVRECDAVLSAAEEE